MIEIEWKSRLFVHGSSLPSAAVAGLLAALFLAASRTATAQSLNPISDTFLTKTLFYAEGASGTPALAASNAAVFQASVPGLGDPQGSSASLTLPSGSVATLPYSAAGFIFALAVTNNTQAGLDAAYPAGKYLLKFTYPQSPFLSFTNAPVLAADSFPAPPQFSNYGAAQQINPSQDFTLQFGAFGGSADPDDSFLEIFGAGGALVFSNSISLDATSLVVASNTLAASQNYLVHLRFRQLSVDYSGTFASVVGFASETVMSMATTAGQSGGGPAPVLTHSFPVSGQALMDATVPLVLQFSEPMNQADVSIQWTETFNGATIPLNSSGFTYDWTDPQTLACFYGAVGGSWPPGAVVSWALNPVAGGPLNFSSATGALLPAGVYSGSLLTLGGPFRCAAQINNPVEAPAFSVVKAVNYIQAGQSPPLPDPAAPAQFLAFFQMPDSNLSAGPPLLEVAPPRAGSRPTGYVMASAETAADFQAGVLVERYSTSTNSAAELDLGFPAGEYTLEMVKLNPANPQQAPVIPTNFVSILVTNTYYPPVPLLVNPTVIPLSTVTNGFSVGWSPWTGASANSAVTFQILDPASNVVFSAPNSCAGLPLTPASASVAIPANTLSNGVDYQIVLSFLNLSDSSKYLTNVPGAGYSALASVTRMSLLSYLSPPPTVTITSPSPGAFVPSGAVALQVTATQTNGFLAGLQLYSGTDLLTSLPLAAGLTNYSGTISGTIAPGPQNLFVKATDNHGQTTTAGPLPIMAQGPGFVVSLSSPANGASFPPFPTVPLAAGASSTGGAITNLQFFMDGIQVSSEAAPPFAASISQAYPGTHQFYAIAYDALGFGGISPTVSVTVAAPANNRLAPFFSTNGSFSAGFAGTAGSAYVLEAATNLAPPVSWTPVQTKLFSKPQDIFADAASGRLPARYYRVVPLSSVLSNAPAFSVWGLDNRGVTASNVFDLEGALVTLAETNGFSFTLSIPPGAMGLTQPVSVTAVTNVQGYPFAGPVLAAVDLAPAEYKLFVRSTLTIQLPAGVAASNLTAFTYHEPNGELFLTPFTVTNVVTGAVTNSAVVIPVNRLGGYGLAALTSADPALAAKYQPSNPSDSLDQATALYLQSQGGQAALLAGTKTGPGRARPAASGGPGNDPALVQQFLDEFDNIYPAMQQAAASGDYTSAEYASWLSWEFDLEFAGLQSSFSVQLKEFNQALAAMYVAYVSKLIQEADEQHDWSTIYQLMQIDLSGHLNDPMLSLGWPAGQPQALQEALDECLTFTFELDTSLLNSSSIGAEVSHLQVQVSFQQGNPSTVLQVKGKAAPTWLQEQFPSQLGCSAATAAPTTPTFLMFGINASGSESLDAAGHLHYNVTGLEAMFWPANPSEGYTMVCMGYTVTLPDYWWPEFGYIYEDDLAGFPTHGGAPNAAFEVSDGWQIQGGGGNSTLATRTGNDVESFSQATVTETSTFTLTHTPL